MQTQRSNLNFEGQNVYVGIDVHLKSWTVTLLSEKLLHKTFTQPSNEKVLYDYLVRNFPGAKYFSVYEAGFCGFHVHYKLMGLGINNIIVNPADVPTSQKEQLRKDDPIDSRKLAWALRAGGLTPIYVPETVTIADRTLLRHRASIVKDMIRLKQRLKSLLYFYGITYPLQFAKSSTHWSRRFMKWLEEEIDFSEHSTTQALHMMVRQASQQKVILLEVTQKLRELSKTERYARNIALLLTIPGIGFVSAITILVEIEQINRFSNTDQFAGYVGLVPNKHSSGEKDRNGELTFRGNNLLRKMITESAWCAARLDPALCKCFNDLCRRMEPNKAIIRIGRKLLNRIYYVLKNQKEYVFATIK